MALRRVWNFIKTHKKKFLVAGALLGGAALLSHYSQRKIREWEENEMSQYVDRMKREQHFESTQKTYRATLLGLVPKLHERILALSYCEAVAAELREKPPNKLQLWEELKRLTFSRVIVEVYGLCLMVTALNVQLSILGGYMFLDAVPPTGSSSLLDGGSSVHQSRDSKRRYQAPLQVQQKYLNMIQHFMDSGCEALYAKVLTSVTACVGSISLAERLTIAKLKDAMDAVRKHFESSLDHEHGHLFAFVVPNDSMLDAADACTLQLDALYQKLINETRDIFESDDCRDVMYSTVDAAFSSVLDGMLDHFCPDETSDGLQFCNPNDVSVPLAKIIPLFVGLMNSLFTDRTCKFASALLSSEIQKTFGANIYEAFSRNP